MCHVTENARCREGQASNLLGLMFTHRDDTVTRLEYEMPLGRVTMFASCFK